MGKLSIQALIIFTLLSSASFSISSKTSIVDSWIFYDKHKFISIKVRDIYNCIIQNRYRYAEFIGKGDTEPKKAFLVNKELLYSYGKELGWGNPSIEWRK